MEDKELKTEPNELEKMAEGVTLPNQIETESKDRSEESADGAQAEKKDSAGGESASWLTILPKEFREDAKGCDNLSAYLKKLKSGEAVAHDTEEDWENLYSTLGVEKDSEDRATMELLKSTGISTKKAEEYLSALSEKALAKEAEGLRAQKEKLESFLENGKKSDKAFLATVQNGMAAYSKNYPEEFLEARKKGYLKDPLFVSALYTIGKGDTEISLQSSNPNGTKKKEIDPLNPYGY